VRSAGSRKIPTSEKFAQANDRLIEPIAEKHAQPIAAGLSDAFMFELVAGN
jgi:hypothetical protein